MRTRRTLTAAALALVALAACSGDDDGASSSAAADEPVTTTTAAPEPEPEAEEDVADVRACDLLTQAEVAAAIDPAVVLVEDEDGAEGTTICTYQVESATDGAQLQWNLPGGRSQFDFDQRAMSGEDVGGIGDAAFLADAVSNSRVEVLVGDQLFVVTAYYGDEARHASAIAAAKSLASNVVEDIR